MEGFFYPGQGNPGNDKIVQHSYCLGIVSRCAPTHNLGKRNVLKIGAVLRRIHGITD
jgi:hypothetical protein